MSKGLFAVFLFAAVVASKVDHGQEKDLSEAQKRINKLQAPTLVAIDKLTFLEAEIAKLFKDITVLNSDYEEKQSNIVETDDDIDGEQDKLILKEGSIIIALKILDLETKCLEMLTKSNELRAKILKNYIEIEIFKCYESEFERYEKTIETLLKLVHLPSDEKTYEDEMKQIGSDFKRQCSDINDLLFDFHSKTTDTQSSDHFNEIAQSYYEEIEVAKLSAMNQTYSLQVILIISMSCLAVFCLSLFYVKVIRKTKSNVKKDEMSRNSDSKRSNRAANHGSSKHPEID
ncbi:MAG: hypothetical protein MHPSP_001141, partial [Paramarteilia canceri]